MKKVTFGFLAMSLACCSSCISSSSRVLTQEDIDNVTANPTGEAILSLGEALKPLKKSGENQQMYWAGLRALTVLSGDGWLEAQQALACVHGQRQKKCIPAKTIKSIEEFQDRKEELEEKNALVDTSYNKKIGNDYVEEDWNVKFLQPEGNKSLSISFQTNAPEWMVRRYKLCPVKAGFPLREDMVGEYRSIADPWSHSRRELETSYGWKIHVSAWPSSAEKITSIVLDCIKDMENEGKGVCYKYPSELPALRTLYFSSRYKEAMSQRGKAIAIYPDNDEQAREIVVRLNEKFKEALKRGELTPSDFCPLTGEYQIGGTGGIFARLCFYNERGEDVRRNPEIRDGIALAHVGNELARNADIISEKLSENELEKYKTLVQEEKSLRKKLDRLLPKKKRIAPRTIPLGGAADQCERELRDVEHEIWKIESNVKSRVAVDYIKREVQGRRVSIENYEHPFTGFSVSLYGHVLKGPVANWPSAGEDGEGDLAALTRTFVR